MPTLSLKLSPPLEDPARLQLLASELTTLTAQVLGKRAESTESVKWAVRDARDGMRCKAQRTAMPRGIASICNAAARPYRADSTDPISVIQWTM